MKLLVVCKGNVKMGLGHLFRSNSFCEHLAKKTIDFHMIAIIEPGLESLLEVLGSHVTFAYSDPEALAIGATRHFDVIIFDIPQLEPGCFYGLKSKAGFSVSISPVFNFLQEVDLVFTRTRYVNETLGPKIYGGLQYSIFNKTCIPIADGDFQRNLQKDELTIGISMGGTDAPNKTLRVLSALAKIKAPCTFWVLLGEGYLHSYNQLVEITKEDKQHEIILAKTNRSMWSILSNCSVAIMAGGLTTVEAVYAGLPTINVFEKQEHIDAMARELVEDKVCINLGIFDDQTEERLMSIVQDLIQNRERLAEMRRNTAGLVDTNGVNRVLDAILEEYQSR